MFSLLAAAMLCYHEVYASFSLRNEELTTGKGRVNITTSFSLGNEELTTGNGRVNITTSLV